MMLRQPTLRRFAMRSLLGAALVTLTFVGPASGDGTRVRRRRSRTAACLSASSLEGKLSRRSLRRQLSPIIAHPPTTSPRRCSTRPTTSSSSSGALSLYIAAGDLTEVRTFAERLRDLDADSPIAAMTIGLDDFQSGRWDEAVASFQHARSGPLLTLAVEILSAWAEQGGRQDRRGARPPRQARRREMVPFLPSLSRRPHRFGRRTRRAGCPGVQGSPCHRRWPGVGH